MTKSNYGDFADVLLALMATGICMCVYDVWIHLPPRRHCSSLRPLGRLSGRVEEFAAEVDRKQHGDSAQDSRRKADSDSPETKSLERERGLTMGGKQMAKPKLASEVEALMRERFPGMENYFVTETYTPSKKRGPDPHKGHHFFVYCGFFDSVVFPVNAQCWRSVSFDGLYKLVLSEDPEYIHDAESIPETKRRFRF